MRVRLLPVFTGIAILSLPVAVASATYNPGDTGRTTRVSQTPTGADANGPSTRARISHDGTHVCFESNAHNLDPTVADTNAKSDVYWASNADTATPTVRVVSASQAGVIGNNTSTFCEISGNGRFVIFASAATNLVPGYTHGGDIYMKDMSTGIVTPVGTTSTGAKPNSYNTRPVISDDGSIIAWNSQATNLVPGHTHAGDVYVREINYSGMAGDSTISTLGPIAVVSSASSEAPGGADDSLRPEISGDGTHVTFASDAQLTSNDNNSARDVYETDISGFRSVPFTGPIPAGNTTLVSVTAGGTSAAAGTSSRPGINSDGSYVTFESSNKLSSADTNSVMDAYERHMPNGPTVLVSVDPHGLAVTGQSSRPQTDDSGNWVAFTSTSARLVPGDTNHRPDAFLRDMSAGQTWVISADHNGNPAGDATDCPQFFPGSARALGGIVATARAGHDDIATRPYLSGDAKHIVFVSGMCDLVPNDNNDVNDIFLRSYPTLP